MRRRGKEGKTLCACSGRREWHHAVLVVAHDLGLLLGDLGEADLDVAVVRVPARARQHGVSGGQELLAQTAARLGVGSGAPADDELLVVHRALAAELAILLDDCQLCQHG